MLDHQKPGTPTGLRSDIAIRLLQAARAIAESGLSDAFGHVSLRTGTRTFSVTPPRPLGSLSWPLHAVHVDIDAQTLPDNAPKEAWIHVALLEQAPHANAVCRAQPPHVAAYAALKQPWTCPSGHAALMGPVAVHAYSMLIRSRADAEQLAWRAQTADVVVLQGNGAVTRGTSLAHAVARMWLLERTAELLLRACAAGQPNDIDPAEQTWWNERADELLPRIYAYLSDSDRQGVRK
jgi:HCOMODA/2-hydroxy-3-carboxy-muconic semialdehyde decarboxylase